MVLGAFPRPTHDPHQHCGQDAPWQRQGEQHKGDGCHGAAVRAQFVASLVAAAATKMAMRMRGLPASTR